MKTSRSVFFALISIIISTIFASFLSGNSEHLKQLSASLILRNIVPNIREILKKDNIKDVAFYFSGDAIYEAELRNNLKKRLGIQIVPNSKYSITIKTNETSNTLNLQLSLDKNTHELLSRSSSTRLGNWSSILPPIFAIILAIFLKRVLLSLGLSIWFGSMLYYNFHPLKATWGFAYNYIWKSFADEFSLLILAFVFVLVGMVNIINRGGGMTGIINQITKIAKSARTTCISTSILGVIIFFDDYLNTIVVGTIMRSFTDKMKVSREKLAYIVDSTSATMAGLAVISTWIGFEILQMQSVSDFLGIGENGYSLFLQALPYRFYCIFTILFVFITSFLRRDFGPMLKAEQRAFIKGELNEPHSNESANAMIESVNVKTGIPEKWQNAVIPLLTVIFLIIATIIVKGSALAKSNGINISIFSTNGIKECFVQIGANGNALFEYLLYSSIAGTLVASALLIFQKILTVKEIFKAFISGWRILPAASILIFAWAIQKVCNDLGTAVFISSLVKDFMNPFVLPVLIFILSAMVSFATGTSFGTMGLMFPTVAPLALTLGNPLVFIISMGAVLDGSIFGDHCSPISDTTVLSSVSSSCNLVDHVKTQLPYAILCMLVAALIGYIPATIGIPAFISYTVGIILLVLFLVLFGKNPESTK